MAISGPPPSCEQIFVYVLRYVSLSNFVPYTSPPPSHFLRKEFTKKVGIFYRPGWDVLPPDLNYVTAAFYDLLTILKKDERARCQLCYGLLTGCGLHDKNGKE